jgi:6-phosphogluconolactonase
MKIESGLALGALLLSVVAAQSADMTAKGAYIAYIGTFTEKNSKGIYAFRFDAATGKLTPLGLAAETVSPSYLAIHPNHQFLYAVNEVADFGGRQAGAVSAFSIDRETGKLTFLNQVSSRGPGPCHLSLDKTAKNLLVANYAGGSVAVFPLESDGHLREASAFIQHTGSSVNKERQEAPHAHCIFTSPDNRFALAADLGLDKVVVYRFDAAHGTLSPNNPAFGKTAPGAGPRHLAFHPNGKYVYVINEIQCTLSTFVYDAARGALRLKDTISTLAKGYNVTANDSTAEVEVHPPGKFVYGSNRGHDSIAVFAVDPEEGTVSQVEIVSTMGKTPRGFGIDPTGSFLIAANQNSDSLVVFRINQETGRLTPTGQKLEAFTPVSVEFAPVK